MPAVDQPLWNETLVVRGGLMQLPHLRHSLATAEAEEGFFNLCFWGENGMELDNLLAVAFVPHPQIRTARVGAFRARGHEPYRSEPWPHLTVMFETEPTDDELKDLVGAFARAIPNPRPAD